MGCALGEAPRVCTAIDFLGTTCHPRAAATRGSVNRQTSPPGQLSAARAPLRRNFVTHTRLGVDLRHTTLTTLCDTAVVGAC